MLSLGAKTKNLLNSERRDLDFLIFWWQAWHKGRKQRSSRGTIGRIRRVEQPYLPSRCEHVRATTELRVVLRTSEKGIVLVAEYLKTSPLEARRTWLTIDEVLADQSYR